jgi:hypothetical protein
MISSCLQRASVVACLFLNPLMHGLHGSPFQQLGLSFQQLGSPFLQLGSPFLQLGSPFLLLGSLLHGLSQNLGLVLVGSKVVGLDPLVERMLDLPGPV